jgi:acetoin utilization deacetylase AcuC-like enzyme
MKKIPTYYSEKFMADYPTVDCENPERAWEIHRKIEGLAEFIEPEPCTPSDLALCHSKGLIESVERHKDIYDTAITAAGGAIAAARCALTQPAFGFIRPPGHHAGYNFNGGFCFFNNIAIALKRLLTDGSIRNGLIVDIDLHYGNGTYDIVKEDERIRFRNLDSRMREEFFRDIEDALRDASEFDIVGCSAGFDTYVHDWGGLLLTEDFNRIAKMCVSANPRFFAVLEGGYYLPDLGRNVHAFLTGIQEACL